MNIQRICSDSGVKLIYLPPYSPDLNPIKEFFSEPKQFIKRKWNEYEVNPSQGFNAFREWCVDVVGSRVLGAEGHFRNTGLIIDKF